MNLNTMYALPQHATVNARGVGAKFASWLAGAIAARRERARLAELDDHLLQDLGLSYREALYEARKPVWDVPAHWMK